MRRWMVLALLGAARPLAAQPATLLSPYLANVETAAGPTVRLGAALTRQQGWLAARVGGAVDVGSHAAGAGDAAVALDADLLLGGFQLAVLAPLRPYALASLGLLDAVDQEGGRALTPTYSAGAGVWAPLHQGLRFEAEARRSVRLSGDRAVGWEVRVGLGVRLGGARRVTPIPPPAPAPLPATRPARPNLAPAHAMLRGAEPLLGIRYRWGGERPETGFDCSGFVRHLFARQGVALPRTSREQARVGAPLPLEIGSLQPGDLLFFASRGTRIDHVALYAGEGRILHASASGGGVRYDDLNSRRGRWYVEHTVAARRVLTG